MSEKKKILVLCGGKFALEALQKLAYEKYLCGVGIGKGQSTVVTSLEKAAEQSQLPFRHFEDKASMDGLKEWIESIQPDYIFSISFTNESISILASVCLSNEADCPAQNDLKSGLLLDVAG